MTESSTEAPSVGAIVRARRGELKLTQKQAAELAGVNVDTLSDLEKDARWPRAVNLAAITRVLGLDAAELQQIRAAS